MGYLCWVNITSLSWEVEGNIPFLKEDLLAKATRLLPSKYPDYVKAVQEKSFLLHLRWEENTRECSLEKVNRIEEEELRSWLLMDGPIPEWTQERETYFRDFACRAMANLWEEKRNLVAGKSGEGNGFSRKSLKKVTEPDLFLKILFSYDSYRLRKMNPKCTGACLWWKDGEEGKNLWIQPYSGTTGKQQLFLEGYGFEELLDWIIQDSQDFDSYLCALDPRGACDQTEPIHCRFTLIFCEKDTTLKAAKKPLSLYPELKETCFYLYSGSYHPISKMD